MILMSEAFNIIMEILSIESLMLLYYEDELSVKLWSILNLIQNFIFILEGILGIIAVGKHSLLILL